MDSDSKYTFIHEYTSYRGESFKVTMEFSAELRADVLEKFGDFLKSCGFSLEGTIEVVEEEDYSNSDENSSESED